MLNPDAQVAPRARPFDAELEELLEHLAESPPRLPAKWFYDETGSALFDRICELPEYYLTRVELQLMQEHVREIAAALGPDVALLEYGSGTSTKTRLLLDALERPAAYVPVDVADEHLEAAAARLRAAYPALRVQPVVADFTRAFPLPLALGRARRRVAYFPGSTIGNFDRASAVALLANMRRVVGAGGAALVGTDLRKDPAVLEAAYDDAAGVTAAFNRNILAHLNARFGSDFDPEAFRHRAPWCEAEGRIEMHLVARRAQRVRIGHRRLEFRPGEYLLTEYSHKYAPGQFEALAAAAGWRATRSWTDAGRAFRVHLLET